jgi:hypothetical protein
VVLRSCFVVAAVASFVLACGGSVEEREVTAFVEKFVRTRDAGLPADAFLSAAAAQAYEQHRTGLWLYDETLPGGPGAEYESSEVTSIRHAGDVWTVDVRIEVRWLGDSPPGAIVETLTVGPGGQKALLVLASARLRGTADGLPTTVAETRERIYRAAVTNDDRALRALLDPDRFIYGPGTTGNPIPSWRRLERVAHVPIVGDVLPGVIHTRYARDRDTYVWRARRARVGIREDGTWLFFLYDDR